MSEKLRKELTATDDLGGFDGVRLYEEHSKDGVFGKSAYTLKAGRVYCQKLKDTLVVAYDGSVSRCNHVWFTEAGIGLNKISIEEAWTSKHMEKIRRDYPDTYCSACDQWTGHTCGESWRLVNNRVAHKIFGMANKV